MNVNNPFHTSNHMPANAPPAEALYEWPIGLFDSGVGGLTVLAAMTRRMPGEDFLYLGDTARLPYGSKSPETIIRYAIQAAARLVAFQIKLLVVACNTVSAVALPALHSTYPDLPIIGVVEPGALAACRASKNGSIAVIGTASTILGKAYPKAIACVRKDAQVHSLACPLFVPLAEEGWFDGPLVEGIVRHYLTPFLPINAASAQQTPLAAPDTLVLGCTHYPMLAHAIRTVVGPALTLVDSAATTAEAVQDALNSVDMAHPLQQDRQGVTRYFTTDDKARFAATGTMFLQQKLTAEDVELMDL